MKRGFRDKTAMKYQGIITKKLHFPQEVCFLSRNDAIEALSVSPATFSRALEVLNVIQPKGYKYTPRSKGLWVSTVEVLYQYLQIVKIFGTTAEAIGYINKHMEEFWDERETEKSN